MAAVIVLLMEELSNLLRRKADIIFSDTGVDTDVRGIRPGDDVLLYDLSLGRIEVKLRGVHVGQFYTGAVKLTPQASRAAVHRDETYFREEHIWFVSLGE